MRKHKYRPPFFTRTGRGCRYVEGAWNQIGKVCNKTEDDPAHVKPALKLVPRPGSETGTRPGAS